MKALTRRVKILFIVIIALYAFVMYKYSFMNNTYQSSETMITFGQSPEELSLDTCTNEKIADNEKVSEENLTQAIAEAKNYDLNTILGREEYIWDFLIKCRFLTNSSCCNSRKHKARKLSIPC